MASGITTPIPDGVKISSFTAQWAGIDRTDPKNQFDIMLLGSDGNLYHAWFIPGTGWSGYEVSNHLPVGT